MAKTRHDFTGVFKSNADAISLVCVDVDIVFIGVVSLRYDHASKGLKPPKNKVQFVFNVIS